MKEENLSTIKRYPITAYLESKGITPVRRLAAYAMYRSPLRDERHPSFKVDTEKNLWIDYAEGCGGSIIDLYMRLERCTFPEAIRCLGQMIFGHTTSDYPRTKSYRHSPERTDGGRKLIGISDDLPPHLQDYLTKERCIDLGRARPFLRCVRYEVQGRTYEVIGFANASGGYELRGAGLFKGTLAPKDITPAFPDGRQPVCLFEGFMDFLSFLSMKEKVDSHCLVMNSVANVGRCIRYLRERHITALRAFLDNDEAGRRTLSAFIDAGFQVEDMSVHYRGCKDLNEFHVSRVCRLRGQQGQAPITTKPTHTIKQKRR